MLRELRVRNLAVIDAIDVEFEPGFNVLTGETGAGKSVLIDALLLVRGGRAQVDVIRTDADTATVEAAFDVDAKHPAARVLDDAGLFPDDGRLVIRREVSRAGRHRAFVNDTAVTVGLLERLGDHLVDVHGQHEHQRLLEPGHQLALLDRFADTDALRERVAALFAKRRAAADAVERLRADERDRAQREDLLRFQVSEIDAARLRAGEEEELRTELRRLKNVERLSAGITQVEALLVDDPEAVSARLVRAAHVLTGLARLDAAFAEGVARLEAASAEVEEAIRVVRMFRDELSFDPARLGSIDDRLDALSRLQRKYGDTAEAILRFRDEAAAELERLARHEQVLATEERTLAELTAELDREATVLSTRRRSAADRLAARTQRELRLLGMERAVFEVVVERLDQPGLRGADRVEFRLSTNPGEDPRPLARVASGGELSRTMLALVTVLATADPVGTMVFDEVDAGIGARVAAVVAEKLATVAEARQVLCVTHLAPIAARAAHHVRVEKTVRGGRTRAAATALDEEERVAEVARMLGGDAASATAQRHARELLRARRGRSA
ncbi:MAG: DNA repair protein RecN [Candidatus Rokubacteria bacterium]|nr:DNA repair protein RecN [Candidatus Rokubacteria bacterium]